MAVPKRKVSKSRKGMRRAHHRMSVRQVIACSQCGNSTLSHRVCPHCGYYDKKEIVAK